MGRREQKGRERDHHDPRARRSCGPTLLVGGLGGLRVLRCGGHGRDADVGPTVKRRAAARSGRKSRWQRTSRVDTASARGARPARTCTSCTRRVASADVPRAPRTRPDRTRCRRRRAGTAATENAACPRSSPHRSVRHPPTPTRRRAAKGMRSMSVEVAPSSRASLQHAGRLLEIRRRPDHGGPVAGLRSPDRAHRERSGRRTPSRLGAAPRRRITRRRIVRRRARACCRAHAG
jgi:hypothetical protein